MAVIIKNTTPNLATWGGTDIDGLSEYALQPSDTNRFLTDDSFKAAIEIGEAVVNDGVKDLNVVDAVLWMQGYTPNHIKIIGSNNEPVDVISGRLQLEINNASDTNTVKVSGNDIIPNYLEGKIQGFAGNIDISTLNDGGDEKLNINIGNNVFNKISDTTSDITEGNNLFYTSERVKNFVEENVFDVIKDPTGFPNVDDSTISFDELSRTFIISPKTSSFDVYVKGRKFTFNSPLTYTIPDTTAAYYIALDISGSLTHFTSFSGSLLKDYAYIGLINWSATLGSSLGVGDERHGLSMDWATHEYLHMNLGARIRPDSFQIGNFVLNGNGSSDSHVKASIENGILYDEDLAHTITHATIPSEIYQQNLTPVAFLPILHRVSGANEWQKVSSNGFLVLPGTNTIKYNKLTAGEWSLADAGEGKFVAMWVMATHYISEPIRLIMGQNVSDTLDDAKNANLYETLDLSGIQIAEFKVMYRLIFQTSSSYLNDSKARLVDILDIRKSIDQGQNVTLVNDHGLLTGLNDDDHLQYIKIDGTRSFTGSQSLGGNALTNVSTVNSVVVESHKARHEAGGADPINHDSLTGFASSKHIDHTAVSINNGYGITGGGNIASSRTLAVNLDYQINAINNNTIQTTSTTMNSTGLVVTLSPGFWFINYSSIVSATSNGRLVTTELYINGADIPATESQYRVGSGGGLLGGLLGTSVDQGPTTASTVISVTGNHTLELRWRTSGGTAVMQQRQITAIRIG